MAMLEYLRKFDADRFNFVRSSDGFVDHDVVCFDLEMLELSLAELMELKPTKCLSVKEIRPILQQVCQHSKGKQLEANTQNVVHFHNFVI